MLNIRTIIFSVSVVVVFMFTAQFLAARTEVVSNPSSNDASLPDDHNPSSNPGYMDTISSYRSSLGECFDVPLREATVCREASQTTIHPYRSPIDECFDVSIWEVASCRAANRASTP